MGSAEPHAENRAGAGGVVLVLALWLVATAGVILTNAFPTSRAAQDQDNYHLRTALTFAQQLPNVDLRDYRSATTPGYHLVLAEAVRLVSTDPKFLRGVGAVFTLGLLATVGLCAVRRGVGVVQGDGGGRGADWTPGALVLPLACSLYVFSAGAWILPDNAAWWGVLGMLALALFRAPTAWAIVGAGGVLLVLVLCRQIHLWGAGVLWLWAFMGGPGESPPHLERMKRTMLALVVSVPSFAVLWWFSQLWHGLVPPLFQGGVFDPVVGRLSPQNTGPNAATPAFLLTLFGIFGVFFAGYLSAAVRRARAGDRGAIAAVVVGGVVGAVLAILPETSFNPEAGRYTGFWALAAKLPVVQGRSLFILAAAIVGGAVVGLCVASLRRREAVIVLAAIVGFMAAQTTAFAAWQRYMEPMVLIVLALVAVVVSARGREAAGADGPPGVERWAALGPALLGLVLAGITVVSLRSAAG